MSTKAGAALIMTWTERVGPFTGVCALSVGVTENENVPTWVGVPDKRPSVLSVSPGGSVPVAAQA